jgi:transposase-like protein
MKGYNKPKGVRRMDIIAFQEKFGTEDQCRQYLFEKRWPEGFICPKCGDKEYFNVQSRHLYQCKACNHQASVTAGTIMDRSQTPLVKWFMTFYLMSEDKRGISALALMKRIRVAYNTAWTICHKTRHAMGERDENYRMDNIVEIDEAFFGSPTEGGKRGRGTDKTVVLVSVSLSEEGKPEYAKMEVVESVDKETVNEYVERTVNKGSEIRTDGLNVYKPLEQNGYTLKQKKSDVKKQPDHLHWTHIIISNAKAFIGGTYHGLDAIHLQRYLDEFCYRFNRRWFSSGIFSRLVNACLCAGKITAHELIG